MIERSEIIMRVLLVGLLLLPISWSVATRSEAQAPPPSQCVTNAVAGGTGDAITIPTLPCVPTTTLLILTMSYANTTGAPTIAFPGGTAQVIQQNGGLPLAIGQLFSGFRAMLSNNGANWFLLNSIGTGGGSGKFVSQFGGDLTGTADATGSLDTCLTSVGPGGVCTVDAGGKLLLLGNVSIPANTTLDCGWTFKNQAENPAAFATMPALRLDSSHTIAAAGEGAGIRNCLIYRNGMPLPSTNSSAFVGLAVSDGGFADFAVTDSVIGGFDTCVYITGKRPWLQRLYTDCNGVSKAAVELDVGNTDRGFAQDIKAQIMFTAGPACTAAVRAGTGVRVAGTPLGAAGVSLDDIGVLGYATDFEFKNEALIGTIWADHVGSACGFGSTIAVQIDYGVAIFANQIFTNQTNTGVLDLSGGAVSYIGYLQVCCSGGDAVALGNASAPGVMIVGELIVGGVAGYAVDALNPGSSINANYANLQQVHGSVVPYFGTTTVPILSNTVSNGIYVASLVTDQSPGANLYAAGYQAGPGSAGMLTNVAMAIGAGTGLGTGSAALQPGSGATVGVILLSPAGTPGSNGFVPLTFPVKPTNTLACQLTPTGGNWVFPVSLFSQPTTMPAFQIQWAQASALVAGNQYAIAYRCETI
jgi:hypothetical protein